MHTHTGGWLGLGFFISDKACRIGILHYQNAVVDPGFPVGGHQPVGGHDLRHTHFLVKTCVKMKELDPVGGVLAAPP